MHTNFINLYIHFFFFFFCNEGFFFHLQKNFLLILLFRTLGFSFVVQACLSQCSWESKIERRGSVHSEYEKYVPRGMEVEEM